MENPAPNTDDAIERARRAVAERYPGATVEVRNWRGSPVVVAREGNLVRLVRRSTNTPRPARQ